MGISYDADLKEAKGLIEEMLRSDLSVIQDEEIVVFVSDLADSAVIIGLRAWVKTEEYWAARWRILEQIKIEFDKAGIEIPYNQDVYKRQILNRPVRAMVAGIPNVGKSTFINTLAGKACTKTGDVYKRQYQNGI